MYSTKEKEQFRIMYDLLCLKSRESICKQINTLSPYSPCINKAITCVEELNLFLELKLTEDIITRPSLILNIDENYINKAGEQNLKRMLNGDPPYDQNTGQIIHIHHIGQTYDAPFAELPSLMHSGAGNFGMLHNLFVESWRLDKDLVNKTKVEISLYWKRRGAMIIEKNNQT